MDVQPVFTSLNPSFEVIHSELSQRGFVLIDSVDGLERAKAVLAALGDFLPQYTGAIEHEVKYQPGFEKLAYSKSINQICVHTEAPGWSPTPRLLALYCCQQARCGGGHTDLMHMDTLLPLLSKTERNILSQIPIYFPKPTGGVSSTMLSTYEGRLLFRFSYNLLTSGYYEPSVSESISLDDLPLKAQGVRLAHKVNSLFLKYRQSILIPDDALLIWNNQTMVHARNQYQDKNRHLIRYWIA
jgi:hypothetical protein